MTEQPVRVKRMNSVTFKTTPEIEKALMGLSRVDDVSLSEFVHIACLDLVEKRKIEAMILIEALDLQLL